MEEQPFRAARGEDLAVSAASSLAAGSASEHVADQPVAMDATHAVGMARWAEVGGIASKDCGSDSAAEASASNSKVSEISVSAPGAGSAHTACNIGRRAKRIRRLGQYIGFFELAAWCALRGRALTLIYGPNQIQLTEHFPQLAPMVSDAADQRPAALAGCFWDPRQHWWAALHDPVRDVLRHDCSTSQRYRASKVNHTHGDPQEA